MYVYMYVRSSSPAPSTHMHLAASLLCTFQLQLAASIAQPGSQSFQKSQIFSFNVNDVWNGRMGMSGWHAYRA